MRIMRTICAVLDDKLDVEVTPQVMTFVFFENMRGRSRSRCRIKWHSGWDTPVPVNLNMSRALWRRLPVQIQINITKPSPTLVPSYTIEIQGFIAMLDGCVVDNARVHSYTDVSGGWMSHSWLNLHKLLQEFPDMLQKKPHLFFIISMGHL